MADHHLVVDITIIGIYDKDDAYNVNLSMVNGDVFGEGATLPEAIADAYAKFENNLNQDRN